MKMAAYSMCINTKDRLEAGKLTGKRIYIRPINDRDTDNIIRWRNSQFVMDNFIYRIPLDRETHERWVKDKVKTGQVAQFIMGLNESGEEFGSVYISHIDKEAASGEFGIFIGKEDMLGKGYGGDAMELIEEYGSKKLGLKLMTLRVIDSNERAAKLYENMGYTRKSEEYETITYQDGDKDGKSPSKVKVIYMEKRI